MTCPNPKRRSTNALATALAGGLIIGGIVAFLIKFAIYDSIGRAPKGFVRIHYVAVTSFFLLVSIFRWWLGQLRTQKVNASKGKTPAT